MKATPGAELLMFVAGEPGQAFDPMQDVMSSMIERITGSAIIGWLKRAGAGESQSSEVTGAGLPQEQPWHLPMQQIQCVNLVFDIARDLGRTMALIDVNRPTGYEDFVRRWVGADPVLPVLVRPDGSRLQGLEEFIPGKVRRFIRGEWLDPRPRR